jgi:hypothetical protein
LKNKRRKKRRFAKQKKRKKKRYVWLKRRTNKKFLKLKKNGISNKSKRKMKISSRDKNQWLKL